MQTRWIIITALALVGAGIAIGWFLWGQPLQSRNAELERAADRLERDLAEAQSEIRDARKLNRELTERQQRIADVVDRAADRLTEASRNAESITELIEQSIDIVDELFNAFGVGDTPSLESLPPQ